MRSGGVLLCLLLVGCRAGTEALERCDVEHPCPAGFACDAVGACRCTTDDACTGEAFCNAAGICQLRPGCQSNQDCAAGTFCHLEAGRCIADGTCGADLHCGPGEVCEAAACEPGCREDADCPLFAICERAGEGLGTCVQERCRSNAACPLGHRCVGERCYYEQNQSLCAECEAQGDCPGQADSCLVNNSYDRARPERGPERFCGPDCGADPELCPSGYACQDVVVLTTAPCEDDAACNGGGRRCLKREGDAVGLCTCARDYDCAYEVVPPSCAFLGFCLYPPGRLCGTDLDCESTPVCGPYGAGGAMECFNVPGRSCISAQACLCQDGACINTGRPCSSGAECNPPCIDGGCVLGMACAPEPGLYCPDLRP
ncbi:MAG: hypothetical protein H6730_19645 [Deltaproteobacteria bacterium]|nr:hypothetical protein [Deltaproteobacteria bacterium]